MLPSRQHVQKRGQVDFLSETTPLHGPDQETVLRRHRPACPRKGSTQSISEPGPVSRSSRYHFFRRAQLAILTTMSSTIFLHYFHQGRERAVPFKQVLTFLMKYGTPGVGPYSNEIVFPAEQIADTANVVRDGDEDALCIAFNRPVINDQFRQLVFEAMQKFGFSAYEDAFDWAYVLPGSGGDVPQALLEELSDGVQEVQIAAQLWPDH